MSDLWSDISADMNKLSKAVVEYKERGIALAHAEAEYKVVLAKTMLEKRSEGVPVTILRDVCLGEEDIALARLNRDCAEALYLSCREGIMALKKEIDVLNDQYKREWGSIQ